MKKKKDRLPYNIPSFISVYDSAGGLVHSQDGKGYLDMSIEKLKKIMVQYKAETEAEIPKLEKNAQDAGSCWQSEKLGHAKGYAKALEEILAKIK